MILFLAMLDTQEEKSKFAKLYETYRYLLWYVANDILRDPDDAEDAVQETYFALTRHMDKIEDVDSTKTRNFLVTIVKSKAIDILRKKNQRKSGVFGGDRGGRDVAGCVGCIHRTRAVEPDRDGDPLAG